MNNFVDYYEFLGIKMSSSPEEIKVACQKKLRENDLLSVSGGSKEYQKIRFMRSMTFEAYQVLSDEATRKKYDEKVSEYRKQLAKKNSYFNAYREDKKGVALDSDVDFSDEWRQILHKGAAAEVSQKEATVAKTLTTNEGITSKVGENSSTIVSTDKSVKSTDGLVAKKELSSSSSSLTGSKIVKKSNTPVSTKPSTLVKSTTSQAKKSSTPVKSTTGQAKKPGTPVKSTTSQAKKPGTSVSTTGQAKKPGTPVSTTSQAKKTSTAKTLGSTRQKPGKYLAVKAQPTKTNNSKNNFSNQVLSVSKAFVRGIVNLEPRKDDTFRKYVLRNKVVLGTILAVGIGAAAVKNSHRDIEIIGTIAPTESIISTEEPVETLDYTTPTTSATLPKEDVITLYRVHEIVPGDTLSKLSADSNTTFEEIKQVNNMNGDNVVLGKKYFIPYIIDANDLYIYTQTASYDPNMSFDEFASKYEINDATLFQLNPGAIVFDVDSGYHVLTDSLVVPNFIPKDEYKTIKAAERITQNLRK